MNDRERRAFGYFGRLRFGHELESIVALLPQQDQIAVRDLLAEVQQLSDEEMKQRFLIELDGEIED